MAIDYTDFAFPKPEPRVRTKARADRKAAGTTKDVRGYVFARERDLCRCCRIRPAQSMHEIKPRSLGGKVSRKNSIATCGELVGTEECCHTYLQTRQITVGSGILGAEAELYFTAETKGAADWMRIALGEQIESRPMIDMELAE